MKKGLAKREKERDEAIAKLKEMKTEHEDRLRAVERMEVVVSRDEVALLGRQLDCREQVQIKHHCRRCNVTHDRAAPSRTPTLVDLTVVVVVVLYRWIHPK